MATAETLPDRERFLSRRQRRTSIALPPDPSEEELARDWTLSLLDKFQALRCRGNVGRRRFAAQLCALTIYGRFLAVSDPVPVAIANHLAVQLDLDPVVAPDPAPRENTDQEYQQRIREYAVFEAWDNKKEKSIARWAYARALTGVLPRDLYHLVERELTARRRVVLPSPQTLERLVASVCAGAREVIFEAASRRIPPDVKRRLDRLLEPRASRRSDLLRFKAAPREARPDGIGEFIALLRELEALGVQQIDLGDVAPEMSTHLAKIAGSYDAQSLRRVARAKRHTLLACYLSERYRWILDQIVEMNAQYLTGMSRRAQNSVTNRRKRFLPQNRFRRSLDTLRDSLRVVLRRFEAEEVLLRTEFFRAVDEAGAKAAIDAYDEFCAVEDRGYVDALAGRYSHLRRYLPDFLGLPFEASPGSEQLLEAMEIARTLPSGRVLPAAVSDRVVPPKIREKLGRPDGTLDRRLWEIGLAMSVRDALRSGDLFLAPSKRYVSFPKMVYSEERWVEERDSVYAELGLPEDPSEAVVLLRRQFNRTGSSTERGLRRNGFVEIQGDTLRLHTRRDDQRNVRGRAKDLARAIEAHLPRTRIEDLLWAVNERCGFLRELRRAGGQDSRIRNFGIALPAAIVAQGTNLGIAAMSNATEGVSADDLQQVVRWNLHEDALRAANAAIVDYIHQLPMTRVWGEGTMSSSDGQRFGVRGRPLLGGFYPRYFGYYERVVAVYTHMSDQFSVFSTLAISCSEREALYVLEGLLEQDTKLEHREHTTDTHGYTEQLFGLCFLLGFSFMPRIRNLADQQLYRLSGSFPLRRLDRVFRATIDEELIAEQWDQLVRVAGSLKRRTARPHDIMRRLASSGPSDRLAKALTALGRVVKTIYILRYINDRRLRGRIQQQLNRGEARHALARRLFFADQGEFLKGDYEEVMNKASCLSLLSNAVTAWNIVEMSRIVDDLRRSGKEVLDEDLARVWPLARRHVIPYGTYRFRPPGVSPQTTTKPRPAARGCV